VHVKRGHYLCSGAVAVVGVVEVIGMVIVVVGADCSAGFGASCFWHPASANTVAAIAIEMIARIFFMNCSPPFIPESNGNAFVWTKTYMKNTPPRRMQNDRIITLFFK
jgi:hypothetical protein